MVTISMELNCLGIIGHLHVENLMNMNIPFLSR
jgi:hypothetical protein